MNSPAVLALVPKGRKGRPPNPDGRRLLNLYPTGRPKRVYINARWDREGEDKRRREAAIKLLIESGVIGKLERA